jgi:hypothetical protein
VHAAANPVASGEASGKLEQMLERVPHLKMFPTLLELAMILLMGGDADDRARHPASHHGDQPNDAWSGLCATVHKTNIPGNSHYFFVVSRGL